MLSGATPEQKRISIYSRAASYSLPVVDANGQEYAGLLETLEPLGTVTAKADSKHWKLRYNDIELQFSLGEARVRMKGGDFDLTAPFLMQNGRGLVPIASVGALLSRILGGPVSFSPASRRVFIGNITVHFTAQINGSSPPSLVMNFTAPVNPMIATDAGRLHMTFTHEPVVAPGTQALTFNNKLISSAIYQDGNGSSEITVIGNVPLFASFSGDRKTITIAPVPSPPVAAHALSSASRPETANASSPAEQANSGAHPYLVVVDPSHGGDDRGATLAGQLAEKDITLEIARRLRQELESRGMTALLLRTDDATINVDQRAGMTNAAHSAIYISLHVTSQGHGVRLYTALMPVGGESRGLFLDWDTAQASWLSRSQANAAVLLKSLQDARLPARELSAPLRPLNNITTAAIAIEIAPPADSAMALNSSEYEQLMASSIATALAAVHEKVGSVP